jgi:hypothetical protein
VSHRGDREKSWRCYSITCRRMEKCISHCTKAPNNSSRSRVKTKPFQKEKRQKPKPSSGDCVNRLAQVPLSKSRTAGRQTDGSTG